MEGTKSLRSSRRDSAHSVEFRRISRGPIIARPFLMLTDPFGTTALTRRIIGCAIRVHDISGPGVLENVYAECLQHELREEHLAFDIGRAIPIVYKGVCLKSTYYVDLVVENLVVVELKAIEVLAEIHKRQVLTYLKLTGLPVGLLLNFNVETLTSGGVKRVINPKFKTQGVGR